MDVRNKTNVTAALLLILISGMSTPSLANEPEPDGAMTIDLVEAPQRRTLTVALMPVQSAVANVAFNFNLKSYLRQSGSEISYRLTNNYRSTKKTWAVVANGAVASGLPAGVTQVSNRPGDCALQFSLQESHSCFLHFHVDNETYLLSASKAQPFVFGDVNWTWGHQHNNHHIGGAHFSFSPRPSEYIDNLMAPLKAPIHILVTPSVQDGLQYDPVTASITGTPNRTGEYSFAVTATDGYSTSPPQTLTIHADANLLEKPNLKRQYGIAAATAGKNYHLNLRQLVDNKSSFSINSQVHFRIDPNHTHRYPEWIGLDPETFTRLQGHVPQEDAGKVKELTIIASTNTGGDSDPFVITIPVAYDPVKKPSFKEGIKLYGAAGAVFRHPFNLSVIDPVEDNSLKVIVDKIEPDAPWLSMTTNTALEGIIPEDMVGQTYWLTVIAQTNTGGRSDPVVIPLEIVVDKQLTPRFMSDHPRCPPMYPGLTYVYDFVANRDIYPEYNDYPYDLEFAKGYDNPEWVRIEDNKLIVDRVPEHLEQLERVYITIKNIPGGVSRVRRVMLRIMR